MPRKKYVLVAVEDIHTAVVGTLSAFKHKVGMSNEPVYREKQRVLDRKPTSLRAMFGMPEAQSMRATLGLG